MLTFQLDGHPLSIIYLALLGLVVGYFAGLFGISGGFLLTPTLISVFGIPAPIAVGSALSQKCGSSAASLLKYRDIGLGEPLIGLVMLGGSLMGVDAGTRILAALNIARPILLRSGTSIPMSRLVIDLLFFVVLSAVSIYTFIEVRKSFKTNVFRGDKTIPGPLTRVCVPPYINLPRVGLQEISVPLLCYLGLLLGVASGVMCIGGGVLFMPILMYGFCLSARHAAATGLVVLLVTVMVGTFEQGLHGFVDLRLAMSILVGSSIGSQLGVLTTARTRNRNLSLAFAIMVEDAELIISTGLLATISIMT